MEAIIKSCGLVRLSPLILIPLFAWGQITETKLTGDANPFAEFGNSVSASGDRLLVGASGDDANVGNSGSAYIFTHDGITWAEEAKLIASDGATNDYFGHSVSLSGDYALIGAIGDDDNGSESGSAYVFHFDGSNWVEEAKLTASDGAAIDHFGESVSLSGNYALVGAPYDDDNGTASGSAYIFHFDGSNWADEMKLTASDGAASDYFGESVSLSGDYALIGTFFGGSTYVFHFDGSTWVEETKLIAGGSEVSLSGNYALIGTLSDSASIFHFDGSTWVEEAKLAASDGTGSDGFGHSVSLSGNYALIGAPYDDDSGTSSGSAYIFHFDGSTWVEEAKLTASDGAPSDLFGWSVSLLANYALIGTIFDDDNGSNAGSAYVYTGFTASPVPCDSIDLFQARCTSGGTIRARVVLLNSTSYAGEEVIMDVDGVEHPLTVITNGTHSKAQVQLVGQTPGNHTVELVSPDGCFDPVTVTCSGSLAHAELDWSWCEVTSDDISGTETGENLPPTTMLVGNYPNPFNPSTAIKYELSADSRVVLNIYTALGEEIAALVNEHQLAGVKSVVWDGRNQAGSQVASGIYIYRLTAGNVVKSEKMIFVK